MSKVYPHLDYLSAENDYSNPPSETNCTQIFTKAPAMTRDILEKLEHVELAPEKSSLCGHECRTTQIWRLAGLILLFLFGCTGSFITWNTDTLDNYVLSQLHLVNGTKYFDTWKKPYFSTYIKVYMFNYTNVEEFERGTDKKLNVKEIGPYVYEEFSERVNLQYNHNGTISYNDRHWHKFRADLSNGYKQSDRIIVPNLPMLGAAAMSQNSFYVTRLAMSGLLKSLGSKPFISLPAHRFLWGYDDNLYDLAKKVLSYTKPLPYDQIGLLAGRNGTSQNVFTINTGEKDITKLGLITRYNGEDAMDAWSTRDCNRIEGSDGAIFPPYSVRQKQEMHIFDSSLCRRLPLQFKNEANLFNKKVPAYKYTLPMDVFDTPDVVPDNQCYCDMESGSCPIQGVFNATPCSFGSPIFVSFPHFYNGDPSLREAITGLEENPQERESFVFINPTLGVPVSGKTRLQMNVQVKKSFGLTQLDDFEDDMLLPIAWLEMGVDVDEISPKAVEQLTSVLSTITQVELLLKYGALLMMIVPFIALLILLKNQWCERHRRTRTLQRFHSAASGRPILA